MDFMPVSNPNDFIDHIGNVVSIQVFKRKEKNSEEINTDSLKKYVGKLQSYWITPDFFCFSIEGIPHIYILKSDEYFELWVPWNTADE